MATALVEAVKKFKADQAAKEEAKKHLSKADIAHQNLRWDLESKFVGMPMTDRTMAMLSAYIDNKLTEFANIYGYRPVIPERVAEQTEFSRRTIDGTREPLPNEYFSETPPVRARGETQYAGDRPHTHIRLDNLTGQVTNPPYTDIFGPDTGHRATELLRECFVEENFQGDAYMHSEMEDLPIREQGSVSGFNIFPKSYGIIENAPDEYRGPKIYLEATDDLADTEVILPTNTTAMQASSPDCLVGMEGVQSANGERIIPRLDDPTYPFRSDEHVSSEGELESCGTVRTQGVSGQIPFGTLIAESSPDQQQMLDDRVNSHGALPQVRYRLRDTFIRHRGPNRWGKQLDDWGVHDPSWRGSTQEDVSATRFELGRTVGVDTVRFQKAFEPVSGIAAYVTGYTVDYKRNCIDVKVLTAPGAVHIDDNDWFGYCTSGTLKEDKKEDVIRKAIKANLLILSNSRATPISSNITGPERTALETLREMVTEEQFRQYLSQGFLNVRGASGRWYQIFREKQHIKVWYDGLLVEEICIGLKDKAIPPTDKVIALKNLLEVSEDCLRSSGNIYKMAKVA